MITTRKLALALHALLVTFLVASPAAGQGTHRFHDPRLEDRPIDRCIRSARFDGCRATGGGNFSCVGGPRPDRCGPEAQQAVADAFCARRGYPRGARDFATEFVGPWPQRALQFREPREGEGEFRRVQAWDVFSYIECRGVRRERLATYRYPKVGGSRVDRCVNHIDFGFFERCNSEAQGLAADRFCQRRGYDWALQWEYEGDIGLHAIFFLERTLGGGLAGNGFGQIPGTEALRNVKCEKELPPIPSALRRGVQPRFRPPPSPPRLRR